MSWLPIIGPILDKILERIPDPNERAREKARLEAEIEKAAQAVQQGQIETNKIEAGHRSIFVAGWRPFLGWVGGVALSYQYIVRPLSNGFGYPMPEIDMGDMITLLGGMLGFGTLRTFEKYKGVTHK